MNDTERTEKFRNIEKLHIISCVVFAVLAIVIVVYSTFWGGIQGKSQHWTDNSEDWQTCFTQASFITIPLNATIGPTILKNQALAAQTKSCLIGSISGGAVCNPNNQCQGNATNCFFNSIGCIQSNAPSLPPPVPNVNFPTGAMLGALSYIGNQALIFTAMGLAFFNRGLRHTTWMPSTIVFLIYCLFAVFTYYTVNPVLPVPTQTNATLLTFLQYAGSKTKYDVFNNSDNSCDTAFNRLWAYLVIILFVAGILAFNLVLAIYAQTIRGPPKKAFRPLEYTKFPRFFASLALFFYLLFCAGKASGSKVALSSILDFNYTIEQVGEMKLPVWFPKIWFPFAMPSLDINTILFIAAFMSAFRGHSIQSVSAFKMAAVTSLIFSLTSYPSIVGAYEFYYFNNFNEWSDCYNYFFEGNQTGFFGYPSEDLAKLYCQAFRFSLAGITGMFILMHLVFISSFYCFYKNSHRASFDSDHNKTDLGGAGNQSNNQTSTLTSPLFAGSAGGQGRN